MTNDEAGPRQGPSGKVRAGDELELEIEALCSGGEGLGRAGGLAVFVPFTAPGDRVRVTVERVEKRFLRAKLASVVTPSTARRAPRCRHFGTCGGCAWQHVEHAAQLVAKEKLVRDALQRVGGIAWERPIEVLHAGEWGWRARAELHGRVTPTHGLELGFLGAGSHELCTLAECPVLVPAAEARLKSASALRAKQAAARAKNTIVRRGGAPRAAESDEEEVRERRGRVWLAASDDGKTVLAGGPPGSGADDEPFVEQRIGGIDYRFAADGFIQAHRALAPKLVERALGDERGALAFDLYAGAGLFTLPLARRFGHVVAVESAAGSFELAYLNAQRNHVANVRFEHDDVFPWLDRAERARPDFVLLDPPRAGAGPEVAAKLVELSPGRIAYVSCDPATLARDLRTFVEGGYALTEVVAFDLFPQTPHVETIARLVRST